VAYQLFTGGLIENMGAPCVRNVSRMIVIAREKGIIPWAWIVDETRQEERVSSWNGLGDFGETVVRGYRKDFWQHQNSWIKVFSEKATVGGIVRPVLDEFAVGFQVLHGFGSATAIHDVAEESLTGERYLEILYIGDSDPSGMHMSEVDLPGRVGKYGGAVDITRIALTSADCTDALPSFSVETKRRDPRYSWFKRNYGDRCWELDAMNPNDLRRRLRNETAHRYGRVGSLPKDREGRAGEPQRVRQSMGKGMSIFAPDQKCRTESALIAIAWLMRKGGAR
jgi:hypothetical protein